MLFSKDLYECFVSYAGNPLPLKLRDHSIVTIGGDIIVIGGKDDELIKVGETTYTSGRYLNYHQVPLPYSRNSK